MSPQLLIIGTGFSAGIILFLMITFFVKDSSSSTQYNTLRFLTALCAGFAGASFAGEALFSLDTNMGDGTKLAISGTAGFALFFTVWFTYPKRDNDQSEDGMVSRISKNLVSRESPRATANRAGGEITHKKERNSSVEELQAIPNGPLVDSFMITTPLVSAYAKLLSDEARAVAVVNAAVRLRKDADPNDKKLTTLGREHLPEFGHVSPYNYWHQTFEEARKHGPRMLGALLLAQSADLFPEEAKRDRANLIQHLLKD